MIFIAAVNMDLNNGCIDVTANALAALRRLRRKDEETHIQTDTIYIDQHDRSERSERGLLRNLHLLASFRGNNLPW